MSEELKKRIDELEFRVCALKAKKSGAKAPPTGRKIHLNEVPSVQDGETVEFTGRICWVKDYGRKKSVLIKPLDAAKDDKEAGAFFEWWDEVPGWWDEKPVADCVAQLKINGKYRNFKLVSVNPHAKYEHPGMEYQKPTHQQSGDAQTLPRESHEHMQAEMDATGIPF